MRDGWRQVTLGDVAEVVMGQAPDGKSYNVEGVGLPFIQGSAEFGRTSPAPKKWCSEPRKTARAGDLLISVRAPVGDINWADQPLAIGRGLAIIRGSAHAEPGFLAAAVEHASAELASRSSSGMFASINKSGLSGLPLTLPPLDEQRRIVDLLAAMDAAIEAAEVEAQSIAEVLGAILSVQVAPTLVGPGTVGDFVSLTGESVTVDKKASYRVVGVLNRGRGVLDRGLVPGSGTSYQKLNVVGGSQLVYSRLKAFEGAITVTPADLGSAFASAEFPAFAVGPGVSPEFMRLLTMCPELWAAMAQRSKGMGGRRERLKPIDFIAIPFTAPALTVQEATVASTQALIDSGDAAHVSAGALRALRSSVLKVLLSNEHPIPVSYDRLIREAAA